MIILPAISEKVCDRPSRPLFEASLLVPDRIHNKDFWSDFYAQLLAMALVSPVRTDIFKYLNPLYAYYGHRMHPVTFEPQYYHVGIELSCDAGQEIYPMLDGVLEYSGYGAKTGYYVLLSHPQIQTQDGYILHTMYCHLKKPLVAFSSYQKMLREISLGSHPQISISQDTFLGLAGASGLAHEHAHTLYVQCDFRKFDHKTIVVNPLAFFTKEYDRENISKKFSKEKEFKDYLAKEKGVDNG